MKKVLAGFLAAILSLPAFAGFTHQHDKDTKIIGTDVPCKTNLDPMFVIQLAFSGVPVNDFKQAQVIHKGKTYGACWVNVDGKTFVADEAGDAGVIELGPTL